MVVYRDAGVAVAATLLLVIGRYAFRAGDKALTWGWNDPQLLAHQPGETASDYLASIANAADAWSQQPRDSAQALAQSIREMRQGCDRLIADAHPALSPDDRQWLLDKCQDWRKKFDEQLVKLDQGQSFLEARNAMDKIVGTLSQKIRERAQSSGA